MSEFDSLGVRQEPPEEKEVLELTRGYGEGEDERWFDLFYPWAIKSGLRTSVEELEDQTLQQF